MGLGIPEEAGGDREALLSNSNLLCFSSSQIAASPGYPLDAVKDEKVGGSEKIKKESEERKQGGRGGGEEGERGCSRVNILKVQSIQRTLSCEILCGLTH